MRSSIVLMLLASLFGLQCLCAAQTCPSVGCEFANNLCSWTSSTDGVTLNPPVWQSASGYALIDIINKPSGTNAILTSPLLDSQAGHTCELTFRYYLGGYGKSGCQLTVYQTPDSGARSQLWSTRQATGASLTFSSHVSLPVDCQSGTRYQIIIKGEVVIENSCGLDNQIAIDDITCTATPPTTTTSTTTTTTTSTTTTTKTATGTTTTTTPTTATATAGETSRPTCDNCNTESSSHTSPGVQVTGVQVTGTQEATGEQEATGAIGPGPIVGIVIAVVAVVAVVVVIIVVVVKRRRSEGKREGLPENSEPPTPLPRAADNPTHGNHGNEVVAASRQNIRRPEASGDAPNDLNAAANADDEDAASHYMELNPVDYTEVNGADYLTPIASARDHVHGTNNAHHVYEETSRGRPDSHVYKALNKK